MSTVVYVILAVIGFFIFLQLFTRITSLLKQGKKIPAIKGALGQKIRSGNKVLVYFFSPTCGACKSMTPVIDEMSKKKNNIFKINVMQKPEIGRAFGIMGTPATVIVENEKISKYLLGAKPESLLKKLI